MRFGFSFIVALVASPLAGILGVAFSAIPICASMIHREGVIEISITPGGGVVALRALPREVIGGAVIAMAGLAIRGPGRLVVEGGGSPGGSVVAL